MPCWPQVFPSLLCCPLRDHNILIPYQAVGWSPWLLLSSPFVFAQRAERVLSKDGAGCPLPSPEVLAGNMLRKKGRQGREKNKLLRHPIGGPQATSATGSMTSQPQALVTAETKTSCECLSSGNKKTKRAHLCQRRGTECPCDCTEFHWMDANVCSGSLAGFQGCRGPRAGQACACCLPKGEG